MKPVNTKIAAAAGGLALATAFIGQWEGLRLNAYRDIGGVPTVCYGETRGVKMGDKHTKAECDAMLQRAIIQFETALDGCLASPKPLPVKTKVALVSWSYNVGTGAACKSTLVKLMNSGQYRAACDQLTRWNKDNGKVVKGLVNRRAEERELCLAGISEGIAPVQSSPPAPQKTATGPITPPPALGRSADSEEPP